MLSNEELTLRRKTIGSSDVGAICGLNPWKGRADVLEAKLGTADAAAQFYEHFILGHKLERPIAETAIEVGKLPAKILVDGRTLQKDWMTATPDFYGLRTGSETYRKGRPIKEKEAILVEVKNVGHYQLPAWEYGKKVPDFVAAQVQWQMLLTKHQRAYVVALLGGAEVKVYEVERDDAWIEVLTKECRAFWEKHLAEDKRNKVWARITLERLRGKKKVA